MAGSRSAARVRREKRDKQIAALDSATLTVR
jgi:hypothetical protein